jgi:hypothetical protein
VCTSQVNRLFLPLQKKKSSRKGRNKLAAAAAAAKGEEEEENPKVYNKGVHRGKECE